jgi:hypothetical protein
MEARCRVLDGVVWLASAFLVRHHVHSPNNTYIKTGLSEYILNAHNVVHVHTLKQFKRPVINKLPVALPMCFFYWHPKDGSDHHKRKAPTVPYHAYMFVKYRRTANIYPCCMHAFFVHRFKLLTQALPSCERGGRELRCWSAGAPEATAVFRPSFGKCLYIVLQLDISERHSKSAFFICT